MADDNHPVAGDDTEGQDLDTTDGTRSPLTTDDGLTAAAAQMPTVQSTVQAISEDAQHRELQDTAGLDVTSDGTDPLADLGRPGTGTGVA